MRAKSSPRTARKLAKSPGCFHHGDLRRALLCGAELLLEREGPLGVCLRAAARMAGVSQTAPYRHFADKEALLAALAEQGHRELAERVAAAARANPDPAQALLATAEEYVALAAERPSLFRLMFGPQVADKERYPAVREAGLCAYRTLLDTIAAAQREGKLGPGDPDEIALGHWAVVQGISTLLVDGWIPQHVADAGGARALTRRILTQLVRAARPPRDR